MKNRKILIGMLMICLSIPVITLAQIDKLDITFSKTTSLIFQYPIINVDKGSRDFIAQKVNGVNNTLQIKAARKYFPETNLTVITADGKLHHFYVVYSDRPVVQTFIMDSTQINVKFMDKDNVREFARKSDRILNERKPSALSRDSKFKIKFALAGIYIDDQVIFYSIKVKNRTNINYDIQSLRFFVRDKQKLRRTASQEIELFPLYIHNQNFHIKGKSETNVIYALQKFTIPNAKALDIELFEKDGGRNLKVRIENKEIVKAKLLP